MTMPGGSEQPKPEEAAPQQEQEEELRPAVEEDLDEDDVDLSFLKKKEEAEGDEPKREAAGAEEPKADDRPVEQQLPSPPPATEQPAPQAQPEPPAQPQPAQQAQEAPQDQAQQPGLGVEALEAYTREARSQLAKHYELTEEEKELLVSEPEKVLPGLMGRAVLDAVQFAVQAVQFHLPQVLAAREQQTQQARTVEEKFFEAWPQLKGHRDEVAKYAVTYKQMYPQAKLEDAIRDVGAMASVALRLPQEQVQASGQPNGNVSQPAQQLPPHRPAASVAPRVLAQPKPENIFSQMADEYLQGQDDF